VALTLLCASVLFWVGLAIDFGLFKLDFEQINIFGVDWILDLMNWIPPASASIGVRHRHPGGHRRRPGGAGPVTTRQVALVRQPWFEIEVTDQDADARSGPFVHAEKRFPEQRRPMPTA